VKTDPKKSEAAKNWPIPKDKQARANKLFGIVLLLQEVCSEVFGYSQTVTQIDRE